MVSYFLTLYLTTWCLLDWKIVRNNWMSKLLWASLVAQLIKNPPGNAGDLGSIPGLGKSPEEGKGYPLQYSGLENSMDCIVHGVTKSQTWLSNFHLGYYYHPTGSLLISFCWAFRRITSLIQVDFLN